MEIGGSNRVGTEIIGIKGKQQSCLMRLSSNIQSNKKVRDVMRSSVDDHDRRRITWTVLDTTVQFMSQRREKETHNMTMEDSRKRQHCILPGSTEKYSPSWVVPQELDRFCS